MAAHPDTVVIAYYLLFITLFNICLITCYLCTDTFIACQRSSRKAVIAATL